MSCSNSRGFICIILRDLVGGGGNEKSSLVITDMAGCTGRLRGFCVVVVVPGEIGWYEESDPLFDGELLLARSASGNAVGGRLNVGALLWPTLPRISLDEPGVGGGLGRGMVACMAKGGLDKNDASGTGRPRAKYRCSV